MTRGRRPLLSAIDRVYSERDLGRFPAAAMGAVRELVPCDIIAWNDFDPEADRVLAVLDPSHYAFVGMEDVWRQYGHQNPLYRRLLEDGDVGPYAFSDYLTWPQLNALELYQLMYRPMGVRYQIAIALDAPPPQVVALTLNRKQRDFNRAERELLREIRPHLTRAYDTAREIAGLQRDRARLELAVEQAQRAAALPLPLGGERLTAREAQVLALAAEGHTAKGVAVRLQISQRTVHKHLQNAYRKLGTPNLVTALYALQRT